MSDPNASPQIPAGNVDESSERRRMLLRGGALLGGAALAALATRQAQAAVPGSTAPGMAAAPVHPESYIHTTCLQCNTGCEVKVQIQEGVAVKIDGNPYAPRPMDPHLPYATPLTDAAKVRAKLCPKGQAGLQGSYDPYRVLKVLKRAGARGEGK